MWDDGVTPARGDRRAHDDNRAGHAGTDGDLCDV